jgi:plasmid stability protein
MRNTSVTVRNIPLPVLSRIKARAAGNRRSMQGELLAILEAAAATSESRRTPVELLIQLRAAGVASPAESLAMIRADRQR